jgi:hypothetical protein
MIFLLNQPKELRKTSHFEFKIEMSQSSEHEPICNISLCGKVAVWKVDFFDRVEYYCQRHKPGVPEMLMTKLTRL